MSRRTRTAAGSTNRRRDLRNEGKDARKDREGNTNARGNLIENRRGETLYTGEAGSTLKWPSENIEYTSNSTRKPEQVREAWTGQMKGIGTRERAESNTNEHRTGDASPQGRQSRRATTGNSIVRMLETGNNGNSTRPGARTSKRH